MTDDPYAREIGRVTDSRGRAVVIGVNYDAVTVDTLRTRTGGTAELDSAKTEELAQLIVAATWQAAWQTAASLAAAAADQPGMVATEQAGDGDD
jgi:hypothetical protein